MLKQLISYTDSYIVLTPFINSTPITKDVIELLIL